MKVKINRERPGKKMEEVESLELFDDNGNSVGSINLRTVGDWTHILVSAEKSRISIQRPTQAPKYNEVSGFWDFQSQE